MSTNKDPTPKWLTPAGSYSEKKRTANAREERVAKALGGRRTRQSGAKPWAGDRRDTEGRDAETPDLVLEHKGIKVAPTAKSFSIKKEWLEQIVRNAARSMKSPGLVLTLEGLQRVPEDWLMIPLPVARALLGLNEDSSDS